MISHTTRRVPESTPQKKVFRTNKKVFRQSTSIVLQANENTVQRNIGDYGTNAICLRLSGSLGPFSYGTTSFHDIVPRHLRCHDISSRDIVPRDRAMTSCHDVHRRHRATTYIVPRHRATISCHYNIWPRLPSCHDIVPSDDIVPQHRATTCCHDIVPRDIVPRHRTYLQLT